MRGFSNNSETKNEEKSELYRLFSEVSIFKFAQHLDRTKEEIICVKCIVGKDFICLGIILKPSTKLMEC